MSSIELHRANEQLFATAEELITISNQLAISRIGEDCETTTPGRLLDVANSRNPLDFDVKRTYPGLSLLPIRLAFYSNTGDSTGNRWSMLNQVEADIEDETCQLFGVVGGFLLDTIRADRIRLNTEKISDGFIKIINLTPELNGATVDRQIDATGEHYDSRTLEMGLGGVRRATGLITAVNERLEGIVSDMTNTASK